MSLLTKVKFKYLAVKIVAACSGALLVAIIIGLIGYVFWGHRVIEFLSRGDLIWLSDRIMAGRKVTSLGEYFRKADELVLSWALWASWVLAFSLLLTAIIRKPIESLLVTTSLALSSLVLFSLFELFPAAIRVFHLDAISLYYGYKASYIYDEELVYREKPFTHVVSHDFRGSHYSPLYSVDVQPVTTDYRLDENGFRNGVGKQAADMVVIGDSYVVFGDNEADTFPTRLEKKLPGLSVINLGTSGYGPNQYLHVLKRYVLRYKAKFSVFAFYEGNDLQNIEDYLKWQSREFKGKDEYQFVYRVPQMSFIERYWEALMEAPAFVRKQIESLTRVVLYKMAKAGGYLEEIHPDLALLTLGDNKRYKILFVDRVRTESPEDLSKTPAWRALTDILRDFRDTCAENRIAPIFIYVPAAAHIYGPYSSDASGKNWLAIREQQIAARENLETAVQRLVEELKIDYISLSPVFEAEAKKGKLLYMQLDSHWNSEGREIAARFVADVMKAKFIRAANKSAKSRHATRQALGPS